MLSLMKQDVVWLAFFTFLVPACASATSHGARPLEVRSDGSQLLGCISHDEGEEVVVEDAGVSSLWIDGQRLPSPWGITSAEESRMLRLGPGQCVVFGKVPEGYASVRDAAELRDGWPYSFAIRSPEWATVPYSQLRC